MKQKDIVSAVFAVAILMVAGYLGYTVLVPKSTASNGVTVEVVGLIPDKMDPEGLARINDSTKVTDFNTPPDLTGLGNKAPFGP
jgi:hypothetical protein